MAGETFNYLLNAAKVMLFLIGSTMAAANENKKTIEEGLFFRRVKRMFQIPNRLSRDKNTRVIH